MQCKTITQSDYLTVSKVILAYPERFYNCYDNLLSFYDELISLIPNDIITFLVCNNNQTFDKLKHKFPDKKIEVLVIKGWDELWMRDCIGIINGCKIIKPEYHPNYCNQNLTSYYTKINKLSRQIIKECLKKEIEDIPLRFEGGNFVSNDKYAFITDKILDDNGLKSENQIKNIIQEAIGLIPIFIRSNRNDAIGHTDGYINFIDNNRVLIANYPSFPFVKDDIDFLNELDSELAAVGVNRITFYDRPVSEIAVDNNTNPNSKPIYSARGNYINFLQLNKTIILPEYTLPTKRETNYYNRINQEILENEGFDVLRINCDLLSKFGGVLHCISFTY